MNESGTITVAQVTKALNRDCQTIRYLVENKLVSWGTCYRLPGSRRKSYLIYAEKFTDETGIKITGNEVES